MIPLEVGHLVLRETSMIYLILCICHSLELILHNQPSVFVINFDCRRCGVLFLLNFSIILMSLEWVSLFDSWIANLWLLLNSACEMLWLIWLLLKSSVETETLRDLIDLLLFLLYLFTSLRLFSKYKISDLLFRIFKFLVDSEFLVFFGRLSA